ncbi:MAG: HD domain-containing protein [Clostridiales bacterium]|nr:HD domain-containing protein [Clostridiales bacterium]
MGKIGNVMGAMIAYYAGDARRINHFLKVYGFARAMGELEGLDESAREILEIAALTHDIGIRNSERKYGSAAGNYQQTEGPPEAKRLLSGLGVDGAVTDRVCWLIAHHHTYTDIRGDDYQILVEADFLVNAYEDGLSEEAVKKVRDTIFKTESGKNMLDSIYLNGR